MLLGTSTVLVTPAAHAATFDLDFDWSGLVVDGDTTNAGKTLKAHRLDGAGKGYQWANGEKRSTTNGNIGSIWEDFGITITGLNNSQAALNSAPLGLFNSNCAPNGGTSESGFSFACAKSRSHGDNDLATGKGSYDNVSYDTQAQGNLLIFEENAGDGVADDTSRGGTFLFDIANDKNWTVEHIGVVDDAKGKITYTYRDGSQSTESINIDGENELHYFTAAQEKAIANIAVQFNSSGGISGLRFREVESRAYVPEPAAVLGLVAFGSVGTRLKRQRQEDASA